MKWDRTGEENNSGTGGKKIEKEMGLERERTAVALEGERVENAMDRTGEENNSGTEGEDSR